MLYFHLFDIESVADVGNLINELCHNCFFFKYSTSIYNISLVIIICYLILIFYL